MKGKGYIRSWLTTHLPSGKRFTVSAMFRGSAVRRSGKLRERFGTYQEVWTAKEQEIQKAGVLTEKRVTVFLQAREQESAWLKEFYGLERTGIRFIAEGDTDYPERFLPYKDRPAALFVKGNLPENEVPAVAIVGARACTEYGKEAAGFYAGELANAGVNIISGMAAGVDGCAHRGAIERGKPTYAVLGCGVNICYPRENYIIFHAMEENGRYPLRVRPGDPPCGKELSAEKPDHQRSC